MIVKPSLRYGAALCGLVFSPAAFAFDWEAKIGFADQDGFVPETYRIEITRYLDPLSHDNSQPYLESAFLNRIGNVTLSLEKQHDNRTLSQNGGSIGNPVGNTIFTSRHKQDENDWKLSGRYRNPDSPHSVFLGLGRHSYKSKSIYQGLNIPQSTSTAHQSGESLEFGYDYYLSNSWTVGAFLSYIDSSGDFENDYFTNENKLKEVGIQTRRLWTFSNSTWFAFDASAAFSNSETKLFNPNTNQAPLRHSYDEYTYTLSGTYYFDSKTGLGLTYQFNDHDFHDTNEVGLTFSRFFNDSLFFEFDFSVNDPGGLNFSKYGFSFGKRF